MSEPSQTFKEYAWFSVQVDQYYAALRIFARHYDALKAAYQQLPGSGRHPELATLDDGARAFFMSAASALNYMGTTGIFEEQPFSELKRLPEDMVNFGFYTCFCFQWTLFENFVKESVLRLADDGLLTAQAAQELRKRKLRTKAFLEYINHGHVFGHTPFTNVLPVMGWVSSTETCSFSDLDAIRELRNQFIHAVTSPQILPNGKRDMERLYERSMWIMRQFAGNVDADVQRSRGARISDGRSTSGLAT